MATLGSCVRLLLAAGAHKDAANAVVYIVGLPDAAAVVQLLLAARAGSRCKSENACVQ